MLMQECLAKFVEFYPDHSVFITAEIVSYRHNRKDRSPSVRYKASGVSHLDKADGFIFDATSLEGLLAKIGITTDADPVKIMESQVAALRSLPH